MNELEKYQAAVSSMLSDAYEKAGQNISELSRAIDVRRATVSLWYRGVKPSEESVAKIQEYLKD